MDLTWYSLKYAGVPSKYHCTWMGVAQWVNSQQQGPQFKTRLRVSVWVCIFSVCQCGFPPCSGFPHSPKTGRLGRFDMCGNVNVRKGIRSKTYPKSNMCVKRTLQISGNKARKMDGWIMIHEYGNNLVPRNLKLGRTLKLPEHGRRVNH